MEATVQRFLDLWAYAFNTGDTEELMQLCQDGDFCDRFAEDMQAFHEAKIVIKPLKYTYLATNEVYGCYKRSDNTVSIFLSVSEKQAISLPAHSGEGPHEYSTVRSDATDSARGYGAAYQPGTNPAHPNAGWVLKPPVSRSARAM